MHICTHKWMHVYIIGMVTTSSGYRLIRLWNEVIMKLSKFVKYLH